MHLDGCTPHLQVGMNLFILGTVFLKRTKTTSTLHSLLVFLSSLDDIHLPEQHHNYTILSRRDESQNESHNHYAAMHIVCMINVPYHGEYQLSTYDTNYDCGGIKGKFEKKTWCSRGVHI